MAKRHNILRDIPHDLAEAVKAESARRRMSIKNWLIETIRFRLDLLEPPPPKKKKAARKVEKRLQEHTAESAPTLPQELPTCSICGAPCALENCVTDDRGRAVHKECYTVQIGRAS